MSRGDWSRTGSSSILPAVEQRIDSNNKPEFAAGTDPAYIPGLTAPAPLVGKEKPAAEPEKPKPPAKGGEPEAAPDIAKGSHGPQDAEAEAEAGAEAEAEDGPVFEVSDHRGSIRVAREGIRFVLDDQEAEFDWDEVGAVETASARFGRRFTVTVHMTTRRWFNAEVEAPARSALKEWTAQLDAALDAYFEES